MYETQLKCGECDTNTRLQKKAGLLAGTCNAFINYQLT